MLSDPMKQAGLIFVDDVNAPLTEWTAVPFSEVILDNESLDAVVEIAEELF